MKEKKVYVDLREYPLSVVQFHNSPYVELMIYGDYQIDLFNEDDLKLTNDGIVAVFIINYN